MPHKVQANDIKIIRTLYIKEAHNSVCKQVKIISNLKSSKKKCFKELKQINKRTPCRYFK